MSKHHHHKVVGQHWYNGELISSENFFASAKEALNFAKTLTSHTVKVYDLDGEITHISGFVETDIYA